MPEFPSLAHIAVTVTDLDRSTRWYTALFGSDPVLDEDEESGAFHHTVYALSGGHLFGLHTHTQPASDTFDEHNTGLDHVAFACSGRSELSSGQNASTSWVSPTTGSRTLAMVPGSPSATPTESPSSSSHHPGLTESRLRVAPVGLPSQDAAALLWVPARDGTRIVATRTVEGRHVPLPVCECSRRCRADDRMGRLPRWPARPVGRLPSPASRRISARVQARCRRRARHGYDQSVRCASSAP